MGRLVIDHRQGISNTQNVVKTQQEGSHCITMKERVFKKKCKKEKVTVDYFRINCIKAIVQLGQNRNLNPLHQNGCFIEHHPSTKWYKESQKKIITVTTIIWLKCSIYADAMKRKLCKEISAARFYIKMLLLSCFCSRNWHRFHSTALQTPQCHMLPSSSLEDTFWVLFLPQPSHN